MTPHFIVPWLDTGCPHRRRSLAWLRTRLDATLATGSKPWCKARAIGPAIEASTSEILVIHDADVWTEGLDAAIKAVRDGAAWAVPHQTVLRLSAGGTRAFMEGQTWRGHYSELPHKGQAGGGVLVARRDVLLTCPMDPRFTNWGQEDASWGQALTTLYGQPWRGSADLIHLWHPPADRLSRTWGSLESKRLRRRYQEARRDPDAMRQLLKEFQ